MTDFAPYTGEVAKLLRGEPNARLSTKKELKWGSNGSFAVNLEKGTWYDHEAKAGGGCIDLIHNAGFGEAIEWLRNHGFEVEDERPKANGHATGNKGTGKKIVAEYSYCDEDGILLFQCVRFEPKDFRQRQPDGKGGWNWTLKGARLVPFYLPEVIEAIKEESWIFIVEGEKDAMAMSEDLGVCATTSPMGAGKWPAELTEFFRGAWVCLVPDNDAPGRQHVSRVGNALLGVAARLVVLELPDLPEKGDYSTWRYSGTPENRDDRFWSLFTETARQFERERPPSKFGAVRWGNLDDPAPEHEWLVDGVLSKHDRSIIAGPSKSGKSFLAIHASLAVARGVPFFGRATRQGLVVYQAGEGARGVRKRLRAYRRTHGLTVKDAIPFVLLTSRVDLYNHDGDTSALVEEINALKADYQVPLELVVIDTLATATAGADENSGRDMSAALANVARIAEGCGAHVMLVHHMNAGGTKVRGHTSIYANVDQVIEVTCDEAKIRTAVLTKQKDDEDGVRFKFTLDVVELGKASNGKTITSCVVNTSEDSIAEKTDAAAGFQLRKHEEVFFRALMKARDEHGIMAKTEHVNLGARYGDVVVSYQDWRHCYQSVCAPGENGEAPTGDACRKFFQYHYPALVKFGVVGWSRPWLWWSGKVIRGFPQTRRKAGGNPEETPANPGTWYGEKTEEPIL